MIWARMSVGQEDAGLLLEILGNETRRKIIQLLADEPKYLLQLAKEADVSQQAVLKHLALLEKYGYVTSYEVESELAAPPRKYYELARSFYLSIGLTKGAFDFMIQKIPSEEGGEEAEFPRRLKELRRQLRKFEKTSDLPQALSTADVLLDEINRQAKELTEAKLFLLTLKQKIMGRVREMVRQVTGTVVERRVLRSLLGTGGVADIEALSEELDVREKEVERALDSLQRKLGFLRKRPKASRKPAYRRRERNR